MLDIEVLRNMLMTQASRFSMLQAERLRNNNLQAGEYFNEGESPEPEVEEVKIFAVSENTDLYDDEATGKVLITAYSCLADHNQDINADDFIIIDGRDMYRIANLSKKVHPITSEEIGKTFQMHYVSSLDNYDNDAE